MLKGESTLTKHPHAHTMYLTVPARIASDSQFELKPGDPLTIIYDVEQKTLIIAKKKKE